MIPAILKGLGPDLAEDIAHLVETVREKGLDTDPVYDEIAHMLDDILDLKALVPAPWGAILEAFDYALLRAFTPLVVKAAIKAGTPKERRKRRKRWGKRKRLVDKFAPYIDAGMPDTDTP